MKKARPISLLFIIFSLALFFSYHIYNFTIKEINNKKVDKILKNEVLKENNLQKAVDKKENDILGILEISKIHLKQAFYHKDSKKNNVNQNIQVLISSKMPDEKNSTMFLAAHSGNSYLGYFTNLNKLVINDEINVYYQNKKYTYVVYRIYEQEKKGSISIIKNSNEKVLVLTTCKKGENKQVIVMAKYVKVRYL